MTSLAYHFASTDKDSWRRPSRTVYRNGTHIHDYSRAFLSSIFFIYILFSVTKFRTDKNSLLPFLNFFFLLFCYLDWRDRLSFLIFSSLLFIFWHVKYYFLRIHACKLQHKHSHWKILFFFFFFFKHFSSKILPIYISLTFISSSSSAPTDAAFLPSNHSDTSGYIHIKL